MDPKTIDRKELLKAAFVRIEQLERQLGDARAERHAPVAIIGMDCRFPGGSASPDAFWDLLREGRDAITEVPASRWPVDDYYDPDPDAPGRMYARGGGFIDDVDLFDPQFFGIAPREATHMDPQQRLLLEAAWTALENAAIAPGGLLGASAGVFVGLTTSDYSRLQAVRGGLGAIDTYFGAGVAGSIAAGRLAYVLGLRGPAITVDTACSSSLVAVHLAVQSLRRGECRLALAGGVNLMLTPEGHVIASKGRMLAPDSRCKTFDARADGYVRSEGCGIVVLKRLADAERDGDPIVAVIRGSALNQDGRSGGLTAPNGLAQEDVVRSALADAGVTPSDVAYVEAHGTGTSLGDPIEIQALASVHRQRPSTRPLLVGSVKTNIGHLEAAAGIAGLMKVAMSLERGEIPPHLHFETPNPYIPWAELPIEVAAARREWPDGPRLAGVSSFGFSGTNAHLVVEAPPPGRPSSPSRFDAHLLVLSARTRSALVGAAQRMQLALETVTPNDLADFCHTAAVGRTHFEHRLAVIGRSPEEMRQALGAFSRGAPTSDLFSGEASLKRKTSIGFLFTGQGAQYVGMARALYEHQPVFRDAIDRCERVVAAKTGDSLLAVIYPAESSAAGDAVLGRTAWTQPALFAVEYALAELWRSWGVEPAVVLGHSVGEYVAACVAGVYPLEDALGLVVERGRLMERLPEGGAMVVLPLEAGQVEPVVASSAGRLAIAAINAPNQTVVSGDAGAVDEMLASLGDVGGRARRLSVSHAFHSPLVEPMLDALEAAAGRLTASTPAVPVVSNLTGRVMEAADAFTASYWRQHSRAAVRFSEGLTAARRIGCTAFLELGPHPVLANLAVQNGIEPDHVVSALRRGEDDWRRMLGAIARLYVAGASVRWAALEPDRAPRRLRLPTYPFERERYWVDLPEKRVADSADDSLVHPLLGRRLSSPHLEEAVFERVLHDGLLSVVDDHRIFGTPVLPAAAYLELAMAAGRELSEPKPVAVRELSILEPLQLDRPRVLQTIVGAGTAREIEIVSRPADRPDGPWVTHAKGRLSAEPVDASSSTWSAADVDGNPIDVEAYYARLREAGAEYGPAFKGLVSLESGTHCARAVIRAAETTRAETGRYLLHPALLDAAFQVLGVALPAGVGEGDIYLPVEVGEYRLMGPPPHEMICAARAEPSAGGDEFIGDVQLAGADGTPVAFVTGLRFRRARKSAALDMAVRRVAGWMHEVRWRPADSVALEPGVAARLWLIVGKGPVAAGLAHAFEVLGGRAVLLPTADALRHELPTLDPDVESGGVVFVPGVDAGLARDADIGRRAVSGVVELAEVVQVLARNAAALPLTIVSTYAQSVVDGETTEPWSGALWGMGRVVAAEHPELRVKLVDVGSPTAFDALAREVAAAERADGQIALRDGHRYAARLVRLHPDEDDRQLAAPAEPTFGLAISQRGVIDNLTLVPLSTAPPSGHQVQIRVEASGLNFRDVLNLLGMYPGDPGELGNEVAGVVEAVGADVTSFRPGDPVMALTPRAFCSVVNTDERLAWRRPDWCSPVEAATIPLVFLTAHYALSHIARVQPGERVLVHAGAGGVGLAAIQLAKAAGAEVYATAGSAAKRELLLSLGVRAVGDSRSLSFADHIRDATGGEGVDIVLNSLAGDFIPRSLELLRAGGRFIELGKTDVWDAERAREINPQVSYLPVFLGEACDRDPDLVHRMFAALMDMFEAGVLAPLPSRTWRIDRAPEAFRFMSQARHVGKVVVTQRLPAAPDVRADGVYLVTGGTGGLGIEVGRWLAMRGAGRIVLVGRRQPEGETAARIEALRASGSQVVVALADVADADAMRQVLDQATSDGFMLRGVVHAAGVIDDAPVLDLDPERIEQVLRPKVDGAWHLERLTAGCSLDFFVLFAAGAGVLSSPGQAAYAAANTFLDSLAHRRQAAGRPALSIDWGAWAEVGMAARLPRAVRQRWEALGIAEIAPDQGLAALDRALAAGRPQVAILPIDWSRFTSGAEASSFLSELLPRGEAARDARAAARSQERGGLAELLAATAPVDRLLVAHEHLTDEVRRVLGLQGARIHPGRGLMDLGMDSLMAVELRNRLQQLLGRNVPATVAFEYPTIEDLARWMLATLGLSSDGSGGSDAGGASPREESLADDEVERALLSELDRAGY